MQASLDYYSRAVRSLPVPGAADRRVPALRDLRPRAPAHDHVLRGERLPHARGGGGRRPPVLRGRARDRAPVVGRAGDGRRGGGRGAGLGDAGAVQLDDGAGEDATGAEQVAPLLRLRHGPVPPRPARLHEPRGAAARRGRPVVPLLPQGRRRDVHAARAARRGAGERRAAPLPGEAPRRRAAVPRPRASSTRSCRPSRRTRCSRCCGPVRGDHALGRADRAGARGAHRRRRVPRDAGRRRAEGAGRQPRQRDGGADGRPGGGRRLRGRGGAAGARASRSTCGSTASAPARRPSW